MHAFRNIFWSRKIEIENIAGILPENSRNSFVDLQSQKDNNRNISKIN